MYLNVSKTAIHLVHGNELDQSKHFYLLPVEVWSKAEVQTCNGMNTIKLDPPLMV